MQEGILLLKSSKSADQDRQPTFCLTGLTRACLASLAFLMSSGVSLVTTVLWTDLVWQKYLWRQWVVWRKRALCPGQPAPAGATPGGGGTPTLGRGEGNVLLNTWREHEWTVMQLFWSLIILACVSGLFMHEKEQKLRKTPQLLSTFKHYSKAKWQIHTIQ